MKRIIAIVLGWTLLLSCFGVCAEGTETAVGAETIFESNFQYDSVDAMKAATGITYDDTKDGTQFAKGSMTADGFLLERIGDATEEAKGNNAFLYVPLAANADEHKSGLYRGVFEYTQVNGGSLWMQMQPTGMARGKFGMEQVGVGQNEGGKVALYATKSGKYWYIYRTAADNLNKTFRVEYEVDADKNTVSLWVTDTANPSSRRLAFQDADFQHADTNGKNLGRLVFNVRADANNLAEGRGILFRYIKHEKVDNAGLVAQAKAALKIESLLRVNSNAESVYYPLNLPKEVENVQVYWRSSNPSRITAEGDVIPGSEDETVILTADLVRGDIRESVDFTVTVPADKPEVGNGAASYIFYDEMHHSDVEAMKNATGATIVNSNGSQDAIASETMENGHFVLRRLTEDAPSRNVTIKAAANDQLYNDGVYKGEFEYTQINKGNTAFYIQPVGQWAHKFTVEHYATGQVQFGSGSKWTNYRYDTNDININKTMRLEYTLDEINDTASVWITDMSDPSSRTQILEDVLFSTKDNANSRNGAQLMIALKKDPSVQAAKGGVLFNYWKYGKADDFDVKKAPELLSWNTILNGNNPLAVTKNLNLPTTLENGVSVSWASSEPETVSDTGVVTRADSEKTVTLTATMQKGDVQEKRSYRIVVPAAEVLRIKDAQLYQNGAPAEFGIGTFTPGFTVKNSYSETKEILLAAAVYHGQQLETIVLQKTQVVPGVDTYSLTPIISEASEGREVRFFALESIYSLRPIQP